MIKNFTPEPNFQFDATQLTEDFLKIEATAPGKSTYWLTMLTPEAADDLTTLHDPSYIKNVYPPEAFKDMATLWKTNNDKLSVDNFHSFMRGSYTHQVVLELEEHLRSQGKRITIVSYHKLYVAKCYPMHTDIMEARYHIPLVTNKHAYLMMENGTNTENYEIWRMPDLGKVYVFTPQSMHTAINAGYQPRIHLLIDYIDI